MSRAMRRSGFLALLILALLGLARGAIEFDDEYEEEEEEEEVKLPPNRQKPAASGALKVSKTAQEEKQTPVSFTLEHALNDDTFTPCGIFTAKATHSPNVQAVRLTELRLKRDPTSADSEKKLVKLLEYDRHYRVRVPNNVFGSEKGRYVMASLPLKCLVNADLNENYVLHLDDLGNIVAMDYTTPSGECIMEEVAPPEEWKFNPLAFVRLPKDAPRLNPDFSAQGPGPKQTGAEGEDLAAGAVNTFEGSEEDAKKKPPQSFFKRYWMYLVPLGLIVMNTIIAPPPEEQPRGKAKTR